MSSGVGRSVRRRWGAWSAIPSVLAIAAALTVIGRTREIDRAEDAYAAAAADPARAPAAVDAFSSLRWPDWFDESNESLGVGGASFVAGDLAAARAAFEDAMASSSGEGRCRADVNLVLAIEAQGDEILEIDPPSARRLYLDARQQVDAEPGCRERRQPDGSGAGDRLDRAAARLDAKLATATDAASPDLRPVSPEQSDSEPGQSQLDDLDRALDENADTRSQGPELEGGADVGARPPHIPQW